MTSFMKYLLLVPLLMIVHPAPSYCEDDKHLSAVMFLINSKPLMADIVAKATTRFGGQVNAAVAILLAGDQGYSWSQILDAIEAGTLKADGSITGVSPQRALLHQKTLSIDRYLVLTNYPPGEIRDIVESHYVKNKSILSSILRAACLNYTAMQILFALEEGTLLYEGHPNWSNVHHDGFIHCFNFSAEWKKGLCTQKVTGGEEKLLLLPDTKEKTKLFNDCDPSDPRNSLPFIIIPKGCWSDGSYWAKIEDASDGYKYTGSDSPGDEGGFFRHSGIIRLKSMGRYEGELEDEPGYCCGYHGDLWLEQLYEDKDKIRISSIWYTPGGDIVKETDWQDLIRVTCD